MHRVLSRFTLIAAIASLAAIAATAAPDSEPAQAVTAAIDQKAPDFSLTGVDGKTYKLSDYKGKYVVLEWNNFDCPFVKKHYGAGNMQTLQKQYVEKGVVWLTICSSAEGKQGYYEPADMKKLAEEKKLASTAYLRDVDGKVGKSYGAKTTPHMFVINPDGVLIYAGAIDDKASANPDDIKGANNYVQASLNEAMAGEAIAVKSTASYGCSVKYAN